MPRRQLVPALSAATLAATALVVTACSSSPSAPTTGPADAAFLTKVTGICTQALNQINTPVFPYPSFDAGDPLVTQLPLVGKYYDSLSFNHKELAFVKSFGTPKQGQQSWQAFVTLVGDQQTLVAKQISTAEKSDKPGFVASVTATKALGTRIATAAETVGLRAGSSCLQLFS